MAGNVQQLSASKPGESNSSTRQGNNEPSASTHEGSKCYMQRLVRKPCIQPWQLLLHLLAEMVDGSKKDCMGQPAPICMTSRAPAAQFMDEASAQMRPCTTPQALGNPALDAYTSCKQVDWLLVVQPSGQQQRCRNIFKLSLWKEHQGDLCLPYAPQAVNCSYKTSMILHVSGGHPGEESPGEHISAHQLDDVALRAINICQASSQRMTSVQIGRAGCM